jgi:oligogalacturonide lyase
MLAINGFSTLQVCGQTETASTAREPPPTWIDPATRPKVVRVSREPNSASFYFNVNSYTPDGKEMVYTTPDGIFVVDLSTWKTRPVVTGKVRTIEVGHKTPSVFYIKPDERALYVTNIDTGERRRLATVPERASIGTINADETLAAGTYIEGNAGQITVDADPVRTDAVWCNLPTKVK